MAIIPYDSFRQLEHLRNHVDRWFQEIPAGLGLGSEYSTARIDVYETEDQVVAHCEIPGLEKKEDVNIRVDETQLTVQGVVQRHSEIREETLHRKERFVGKFQRSVSLPARVKAEGTVATYKNGILEVRMPKLTADTNRKIDVQFH